MPPTKRRAAKTSRVRSKGKPVKRVSAKTRAADEELREVLRNADLNMFGKALAKGFTR